MSDQRNEGFDSSANIHHIHGGPRDGGPRGPNLEARVEKLENDMTDIKVTLGRIDERLTGMASNLATKADLETIRGDVKEVKGALTGKLGYWQFVITGGGLLTVAIAVLTYLQSL